jgi:hypothetical protein
MDEDYRLSIPKLFARWAGEDVHSWEQAIGVSVTHLSRGEGRVTGVSETTGIISIRVEYARASREHPLCELRTEFTNMTLPAGLNRDHMIATMKARRHIHEQIEKAGLVTASAEPRNRGGEPETVTGGNVNGPGDNVAVV